MTTTKLYLSDYKLSATDDNQYIIIASSDLSSIKENINKNLSPTLKTLYIDIYVKPININLAELFRPITGQITEIHLWFYYVPDADLNVLEAYNLNLHEFKSLHYFKCMSISDRAYIDCKLLPQSIKIISADTNELGSIQINNNTRLLDISHLYRLRELHNIADKYCIGNVYLPNLLTTYNTSKFLNKQLACKCQSCLNRPYHLLDYNDIAKEALNDLAALKPILTGHLSTF